MRRKITLAALSHVYSFVRERILCAMFKQLTKFSPRNIVIGFQEVQDHSFMFLALLLFLITSVAFSVIA